MCAQGHDVKTYFIWQVTVKISLKAPALCCAALTLLCVCVNRPRDKARGAGSKEGMLCLRCKEEWILFKGEGAPLNINLGSPKRQAACWSEESGVVWELGDQLRVCG